MADSPLPLNDATPERKRRMAWYGWLGLALICLAAALGYQVLQPSLNGRGGSPPRVVSASHLRQIGQGILLYQNDFSGQFPDSLITITHAEDMTPDVLVSPGSTDVPATGPTTQAIDADFAKPGRCSYVYLGRGMCGVQSDKAVIAYERPGIFPAGSNVLFGDGHVAFMSTAWVIQLIATAAARPPASTRPTTMPD